MKSMNIMNIRSKVILNKFANNVLIMEALSEKDEKIIDTLMDVENGYFTVLNNIRISTKDIFLYGEINLNNSGDIKLLQKSDIITQEINGASNIPSNFDYETGFVYADNDGIYRCHDTWNKIDWFKFNHLLIGKPSRIIIYKVDKKYVPKNRSTRHNTNAVRIRNNK